METQKKLPKTHWKKLYNPNYLGDWSFEPGKDKVLTIKSVGLEEVFNPSDKAKDDCTVITWHEKEKPMIVNKTNANTITRVAGSPYIEDWVNKKIILYTKEVNAFGGVHQAIRVRPVALKEKKEVLTPDHDLWDRALLAMKRGTGDIDAIKERYTISKQHIKILEDAKKGMA